MSRNSISHCHWVYIGRGTYGSMVIKQSSLKPGSKLFDALGRTYDKIVRHIKQYVFKENLGK